MSLFGPPDIGKMKTKRDVKGLIKALTYKNDEIQREAALALGEIGDRQAVEPLIATLKDTTPFKGHYQYEVGITGVRSYAAKALAKIGDHRAVDPLISIAFNKHDPISDDCIDALGEIGDERAVEPLTQLLLANRNSYCLTRALIKIGTPTTKHLIAFLNNVEQTNELFVAIIEKDYKNKYYEMIEVLDKIGWQPDKSLAGIALCIYRKDWIRCGEIGVSAIEPLVSAMKFIHGRFREGHLDDQERSKASDDLKQIENALIKIGAPAIETLKLLIESGPDDERRSAFHILEKMSDSQALEQIMLALKDERASVRHSAVLALRSKQDQQAIESLLIALNDPDDLVRLTVPHVLGTRGGQHSINPLVAALNNGNWDAAPILKKLGWQPDQGETGAAFWIGMALAISGKDDVVGSLEKCAEIGAPAIAPLKLAILDSEGDDRVKVVALLEQLGWIPESDEFGAAYWVLKANLDKCLEIGAPAVNPLIDAINGGNLDAARILGKIGGTKAVELVNKLIEEYYKRYCARGEGFNDYRIKLEEKILLLARIGDLNTIEGLEKIAKDMFRKGADLHDGRVQTSHMNYGYDDEYDEERYYSVHGSAFLDAAKELKKTLSK